MQPPTKKQKLTSIPDEVKKTLICCMNDKTNQHYAHDAILLPCGGNACRRCIQEIKKGQIIFCRLCDAHHYKSEMLKMPANPLVKYIIESNLDELRQQLMKELHEQTESLKVERMNEDVDLRFSNVEFELDTRIESIIAALHEYREEFKAEMDQMKQKYKRHLKNKGFQEIRKELDSLKNDTLAADYDDFMRAHNLINESKAKLESYMNELNEIKISNSPKLICKDLIGEFVLPRWKKIKGYDELHLDTTRYIHSVRYLKTSNQFITSEGRYAKRLIIYNLDDDTERLFEHKHIHRIREFCIGKDDQIFILDQLDDDSLQMLVFDCNLVYKKKLKVNLAIDDDDAIDFMICDLHIEPNLLYISHRTENKLSILYSETGKSVKTLEIDRPNAIAFTKESIYVASHTAYELDKEDKYENIVSGCNCIFVLNKKTYEIVDRIEFPGWLQPYGLSFDENENLITTAKELGKNRIIANRKYLYAIDVKTKECVQKLKLNCDAWFDNLFFNNKLVFSAERLIQLVEFEDYN